MEKKNNYVTKIPTGVKGFDTILEGGVPRGRIITITGSIGTGKTVLVNEFLYRGITEYNQNGVFVTFEESPSDIIRNIGNFKWEYARLVDEGKLAFVDFSPMHEEITEISTNYDLTPMLLRIKQAIRKINAERVVIDSVASLLSQFSNQWLIRRMIHRICHELTEMEVTGILTTEQSDIRNQDFHYGVEEFVTDGVIQLRIIPGEQQLVREMCIMKLRGVGYRSGSVRFAITSDGLEVYPKIMKTPETAEIDINTKLKLGIPGLDKALDGGIPQGHIVLVSGNTGTGKTLLCMQFIHTGIQNGEKCLYVALEETSQQLKRIAERHGWNFSKHEKEGTLKFLSANLIDTISDKLLTDIVELVTELDAERIVVDSISSIMSTTLQQEKVRQFWIQLASFLKARGITCILSYLMTSNFGAENGQLLGTLETNNLRLSSVTDGMLLLQYVEREQRVEKLLNILKMRGTDHSREIIRYQIQTGGLKIGEKFLS